MRRVLIAIVLAASLTGCGDSPEHKLSLANQFIKANQPDKALEMAQAVINADIKNEKAAEMKEQARFIKAQAYLALNQLKLSKDVLEEIKAEKPNDPEPVRSLIVWAKKSMGVAVGKSDFSTNIELQKQFDDAMSVGESQADLLASRHKLYVESEFVRAELIMNDVNRFRKELEDEKKKLERKRSVDENVGTDESTASIQRLQRKIDQRSQEVESHLANVLKEQPNHVEAAGLYLALLTTPARAGWKEVLDLAVPMSQSKEVKAVLAQQVVMAVLRVPDSVLKEKKIDKTKITDTLLSLVPEAEHKTAAYLLTRAHQVLSQGEKDAATQAQVFLESIQPTDNQTLMEKNFLTAWCLFQQKKYERARLILDNLEVLANGSAQVLTLHANVLMELGELVRAQEQVRRAMDVDGTYFPAAALNIELQARVGKFAEIENQAKSILTRDPGDVMANRTVINQLIQAGNKRELENHLMKLESYGKNTPFRDEHVALLVDGFNMLARYDKVLFYASDLKRRRPDQFATHLKYAEALIASGKPAEATAYLESIKGRFPEAGTGDLVLAQLHLARQQLPEALTLFTRFVQKNPDNVEAKLGLARTLASMEKIDEARKQLQDVLNIDPNNQQANAILARIDLFLGDTDSAGKHIAQIDEGDVDEGANPALKAQILIQKDKLKEARDVCNGAVARGNNDPVLRLLLARIYTIEKNPAQAETHLLALAQAQPNNLQVYRLLGEFYEANKDLQTVGINKLKELQKSNDTFARLALSGVIESQNKPEEALYILTEIMPSLLQKKDPNAFEVANGIARIHLRAKKVDEARDVFKGLLDAGIMVKESRLRQIDLSWANPSVHFTTTQLMELAKDSKPEDELLRSQVIARLAKLEKRDQALAVIDEWIKASPNDSTLFRWKGEMLGQMGRYIDSVASFREAIARDPKKMGLHARLVSAHLQNFDFPAAEAQLRILGAIDAKAEALSLAELGQVYVRLGLQRQAAKTFEKLEKLGKVTEPNIMFAMGKAHAAIGLIEQARDRLAKVPTFARLYPAAQVELARLEMKGKLETQARDRIYAMINDARTRARCMTELLTLNPFDKETGVPDSILMQYADETLRANAAYTDLVPRQLQSQWMRIRVILLDRNAKDTADYEKLLAALDEWQKMEPTSIQVFKGRMAVLARMEQQPKARQLFRAVPQLATTAQGPLLSILVGLDPQKVEQRAPLPEYFVSLATGKPLAAKAAAEALETRTAIYKKDMLSVIDRKDVTSNTMLGAARQLATAVVALDAGLPHLSASLSQNVIKVLPDLVPAHSLLAQALLSQGMPLTDALKAARATIPTAGITYYLSAETKIDSGDFAGASADLVRLLEAEPDNIHAKYRLTQVYQLAGQHELSIQLLEKMHAEGGPYRVMVANDLSYLLATYSPKDRLDDAQGIAKRAQELVEAQGGNALGAAALLDTIGWIELMKGNGAVAINHLNRAVAALSDRAEVHYHVALAYDKQGNREWAKYHMEQASMGDKKLAEVAQAKEMLTKWGG
jgi:tetratricopeptide (TPR) repeat protein